MKIFIPIIIIISVILVIKFLIAIERKKTKFPYLKKKYFLTNVEREFFKVLEEAIKNEYYIFPQVNLSNLLFTEKGEEYYKYHNKIDRKSVDFVIIEKNYLAPLLVIELDDSSHNLEKRIERDDFVEEVLKEAEIPLLRLKTKELYNVSEIASLIYNMIHNQEDKK